MKKELNELNNKFNKTKSENVADTSGFPKMKRTFKYRASTVIKAGDLML